MFIMFLFAEMQDTSQSSDKNGRKESFHLGKDQRPTIEKHLIKRTLQEIKL